MVPLRKPDTKESFGLLVLGSPDAQRFSAELATDFLGRIGATASAALAMSTPILPAGCSRPSRTKSRMASGPSKYSITDPADEEARARVEREGVAEWNPLIEQRTITVGEWEIIR